MRHICSVLGARITGWGPQLSFYHPMNNLALAKEPGSDGSLCSQTAPQPLHVKAVKQRTRQNPPTFIPLLTVLQSLLPAGQGVLALGPMHGTGCWAPTAHGAGLVCQHRGPPVGNVAYGSVNSGDGNRNICFIQATLGKAKLYSALKT